jgi:hypothetical protein
VLDWPRLGEEPRSASLRCRSGTSRCRRKTAPG